MSKAWPRSINLKLNQLAKKLSLTIKSTNIKRG
jgi:hypothetical protein